MTEKYIVTIIVLDCGTLNEKENVEVTWRKLSL